MGTTTIFNGQFRLDRPLTKEHAAYLHAFNRVRHIQRDPERTMLDPLRDAVGLPLGAEGVYYVAGGRYTKEFINDTSVVGFGSNPTMTPGYWCQWRPTADARGLEWDQGDKFYDWATWLNFIIENFLTLWGYTLSGAVEWYNGHRSGATVIEDGKATDFELCTGESSPWRADLRVSRSGKRVYGNHELFTSDCSKLGKRRLRSLLAHHRTAMGLDPKRLQPIVTMNQHFRG